MRIMNDENSDNDTGATIMANMKMSFRRWARLEIIITTPKALQNRSATARPQSVPYFRFCCLYKRQRRSLE